MDPYAIGFWVTKTRPEAIKIDSKEMTERDVVNGRLVGCVRTVPTPFDCVMPYLMQ